MRRTSAVLRSAKGYGWYHKFMQGGSASFNKNVPPTAFDWDAPAKALYPNPATGAAAGADVTRRRAFLDMTLDGQPLGRMVFELADDVVPQTTQNFVNLCLGRGRYGYATSRSLVHNVQKGVALMAGDVEGGGGKLSHSSYTVRYLTDENHVIPHTARGQISMASIGRNTNGSQFYVSLSPAGTPHLNGRSTVFGRLVEGEDVLKQLEAVFTVRLVPVREIRIAASGVL